MHIIENFLSQYPATISTISAFGTVLAVVIALYIARKQLSASLEVSADVYIRDQGQTVVNSEDKERVIIVVIKNVGPVPASINYWGSFVWSVAGGRQRAMQNPVEPDFRNEPVVLLPGKETTIVLSRDVLGFKAMISNLATTSRLGTLSCRFPRLTVRTEIGESFRARLGESLRELSCSKP